MIRRVITLGLAPLLVVSFVFAGCERIQRARQRANTVTCMSNLREITIAIRMYTDSSGVVFDPAQLEVLLDDTSGPEAFKCPGDKRDISFDEDKGNLAEYSSYYIRKGYNKLKITEPSNYIVAYDKQYYHTEDGDPAVNVLFGDEHITSEDADAFEKLIANQDAYGPPSQFFGWKGETPPIPTAR